jgi:hypothetical protein
MSRSYQIALGAKVTITEQTENSYITIPYSLDHPLWFEEEELVEATEKKYHFRYRMRDYYANSRDVSVVKTP